MLLRLALVGMVAALGVTLPSQPKCERWFDSAQNWASGILADWDTWKPREGNDDCLLGARGRTDCPQCRLARARLAADERNPATAAEPAAIATVSYAMRLGARRAAEPREALPSQPENRESIALEPIVLDEDLFSRVAFQLNRMAEGIGIPTACPVPPPPAPAPPTVVDTTPLALEPIAASDDLELSVLGELCRVALETRAPVSPARVAARKPRDVEQPDDDSFVCGAGDLDETLSTQVAASKPMPAVTPETAGGDFVALSETDLDFCSGNACLLDRFIEDAPTPPPVALLADLPQDVFGPSPKTTLAEAPRVASGPPRAAAPRVTSGRRGVVALADLPRDVFAPPEPSPTSRQDTSSSSRSIVGRGSAQPRLGHAVELTREALYAWMNVLTGPALVDVTSR
ncbi:MAG: hypothetical protein ACHRXM_09030 [Isosphaerales bacterium]